MIHSGYLKYEIYCWDIPFEQFNWNNTNGLWCYCSQEEMLYVSSLKKLGKIYFLLIGLINQYGKIDLYWLPISSFNIMKRLTLNGRYVTILPILTLNNESKSRGIVLTTNVSFNTSIYELTFRYNFFYSCGCSIFPCCMHSCCFVNTYFSLIIFQSLPHTERGL